MTEPRYRKNSLLQALVALFSPKREVRINALHPRNPDGRFTFQARVPFRDVREYAESGEIYAIQSHDRNWVGCLFNGEWFRFISKRAFDEEMRVWAEIDARRGEPFPRDLIERGTDPRATMQVVTCLACGKYFLLVAPDRVGDVLYKRCQHCGTPNELEQVSPPGADKMVFRAKRILEEAGKGAT